MIPPQPRSTLFPYTTLFRSIGARRIRFFDPFDDDPRYDREKQERDRIHLLVDDRLVPDREREGVYDLSRSEEHTSELQSHSDLVCRLLLEKKKRKITKYTTK